MLFTKALSQDVMLLAFVPLSLISKGSPSLHSNQLNLHGIRFNQYHPQLRVMSPFFSEFEVFLNRKRYELLARVLNNIHQKSWTVNLLTKKEDVPNWKNPLVHLLIYLYSLCKASAIFGRIVTCGRAFFTASSASSRELATPSSINTAVAATPARPPPLPQWKYTFCPLS
jgi:hypothetical protein